MTYVISLGGSIVAPETLSKTLSRSRVTDGTGRVALAANEIAPGPDVEFIVSFKRLIDSWLNRDESRRVILVVGGGNPARQWQKAYKEVASAEASEKARAISSESLDRIGIAATRLNAQLLAEVFGTRCSDPVVVDPSAPIAFTGRVLVASGWKPGFSTDYDAVYLAHRFGAASVLNLSNIAKVFTADPKLNPNAKPIDSISWPEFRAIVGSTWIPGANLPFDPIASGLAQEKGIRVTCAAGRDLENLENILEGRSFVGTDIG